MANRNNQIRTKLTNLTCTRSNLQFKTNKFNTKAYRDSFVQITLHILRDGEYNLYIPKQTATGTTKTLPKQHNKITPITQTIKSNPPKCLYINSLKNDKGLNITAVECTSNKKSEN